MLTLKYRKKYRYIDIFYKNSISYRTRHCWYRPSLLPGVLSGRYDWSSHFVLKVSSHVVSLFTFVLIYRLDYDDADFWILISELVELDPNKTHRLFFRSFFVSFCFVEPNSNDIIIWQFFSDLASLILIFF